MSSQSSSKAQSTVPDDTTSVPPTESQQPNRSARRQAALAGRKQGKQRSTQSGTAGNSARVLTQALLQAPSLATGGTSWMRHARGTAITHSDALQVSEQMMKEVRKKLADSSATSLEEALSSIGIPSELAAGIQHIMETQPYSQEAHETPRQWVTERLKWRFVDSIDLIPNNTVYSGSHKLIRSKFYLESLRHLQNSGIDMIFDEKEIRVLEGAARKLLEQGTSADYVQNVVAKAQEFSRNASGESRELHPFVSAFEKFEAMNETLSNMRTEMRDELMKYLRKEGKEVTDEEMMEALSDIPAELEDLVQAGHDYSLEVEGMAKESKRELIKQNVARARSDPTDIVHLQGNFCHLLWLEAHGEEPSICDMARKGVTY